MIEFDSALRRLRARIGNGPEVVGTEEGATIPYFGTELVEYRDLGGGKPPADFHLIRRNLGLWVVTAAFDRDGNLIIVAQFKYGVNEVTIQLSPGGAGKPKVPNPTLEDIIAQAREKFTEETGYGNGNWGYLGGVNIDDNKMRDASGTGPLVAHMLIASDVEKIAEPEPKDTEFYEVLNVPPSDFQALLDSPYLVEVSARVCLLEAFRRRGELAWAGA